MTKKKNLLLIRVYNDRNEEKNEGDMGTNFIIPIEGLLEVLLGSR